MATMNEVGTNRGTGATARVLNYASVFEPKTLDQAAQVARGHVTDGHVVMLPDAHFGTGACVGTAVKTRDGIYPAAVGVDIGCGMIAARTTLDTAQIRDREPRYRLRDLIADAVPSGMGKSREVPLEAWDRFIAQHPMDDVLDRWGEDSQRQRMRAIAGIQFGTLGAGNHFVEILTDETDAVWAIVHSGSRGVGKNIADVAVREAKALRKAERVDLETPDLAFLKAGEFAFDEYLLGMRWAQAWAAGNRDAMMDLVLAQLRWVVGDFDETERINAHHNYSEPQGDGTWLTRKGAIDASAGTPGILPGSMLTGCYILEGLGNPDSYQTSAHGSGRVHARGKQARGDKPATGAWALFNVEGFRAEMDAADIVWQDRDANALLDESPGMYKSLARVAEDSVDLVRPVHRLRTRVNVKGLDDGPRR